MTPRSPPAFGAFLAIASAASRTRLNVPIRLMLIARAKPESECGPSLPTTFSPWTMPAQLTRPCTPPNASSAAATAAMPLASSVTSVRTNFDASPSSSRERAAIVFLEIGDHDIAAAVDDHTRRRSAEARCAAGDNERAALDLHGRLRRAMDPARGAVRRASAAPHFTTDIAVAIMPAISPTLAGRISVFVVCARLPNCSMYCSATLRLTAPMPPGLAIASATWRIALALASAMDEDRGGLALRIVDLRLLLAFRLGDRRLARAVRDVDLLLTLAFGCRDDGALLALGGDLRLHRAQDFRGRRQILDLVAQHLDAPVRRRVVERGDDGGVDLVALLERAVELHPADHAAQRRLRQLRDRQRCSSTSRTTRAADRSPGKYRMPSTCSCVLSLVMQTCGATSSGVSRKSCRYAMRSRKGTTRLRPGCEHAVEAAQPLDDPRLLLRHDPDRLDDADQDDDENRKRDERIPGLHERPPVVRAARRRL